jgi:hypothetical protein
MRSLHAMVAASVASVVAGAVACGTDPAPTMFTDGGDPVPMTPGMIYRWTFDDDPAGDLPEDLINVLGDWIVEEDGTLLQAGSFGDPDFPRVVVRGLTFADGGVRVRCRAEDGDVDRACGLMFRLVDSENYYVVRANALEGNIRLYRVVDGDRRQLASVSLDVTAGEWHTLEANAAGTALAVSWDDEIVIEADDDTFAEGKIGLWTKADSLTRFDDLEAWAD